MRRWRSEKQIAIRRRLEHLTLVHGWPERTVECICDQQLGRFRKHKALGCSKARCYLCHSDKLLGRPRRSERAAALKMKEGLEALNGR
jgi:hypothetical protein